MNTPAAKPSYSVLYEQQPWMWHEWYSMRIEFDATGRGKIWWLIEHTWVIVVAFDWVATASAVAAAADEGTSDETQARRLGSFDLTMTLHRTPATGGNLDFIGILDRHYTAGAWEPKPFKIVVEQGIFRSPMRAGGEVEELRRARGPETDSSWHWAGCFVPESEAPAERVRYADRLIFDTSPYPPIEDWVRPVHPRIADTDPETKVEFVAQQLPESEWGKPAMNQAWQREMVRVWASRPMSEHLLQMEAQAKESERRRAERKRARAQKRAGLEKARKQVKVEEAGDQTSIEQARESTKTQE